MDYSFERFWSENLAGLVRNQGLAELPGWYGNLSPMQWFVPANITPRPEFSDLTQSVWLIAAPGAVGKSTLAKEVCALTGAVYLDLAEASTVAGNYLAGGLFYTGLLDSWYKGAAAILVDALDEARLRVTQSGFEDFLADVAKVSEKGRAPIILLGRVGIIEEAWLIINENFGISAPIFDIEFFDADQAQQFVMARLLALSSERVNGVLEYPCLANSLSNHRQVYVAAVKEVISGIGSLSQVDADRFVGYAPVLDAVAKVIAAEQNPARINEDMRKVIEGDVLSSLAGEVLAREAGKLINQLKNTHADFPDYLYSPDEQLHRLACQVFNLPSPPITATLAQQHVTAYERAVKNLLPQHPFLSGDGKGASSSVFEAAIISYALNSDSQEVRESAEKYIYSAQHTNNPFLFDFYSYYCRQKEMVPAEHLGFLFDSVISKAATGDKVRLYVGEDEFDNIESEIVVERNGGKFSSHRILSPKGGLITLGRKISGVSIVGEGVSVQLGLGGQLELVSPTFIQCKELRLACDQVVVKTDNKDNEASVVLEAEELISEGKVLAPIVRSAVIFQVSWPGSETYPWTPFNMAGSDDEAPHVSEGLRTLRRLVMAFRSHSKGQLARFRDKIEHFRMLKGKVGEALLRKLIDDEIVWVDGAMYCLDANKLGAKVGISFQDAQAKKYSDRTRSYVSNLSVQ